MKHGYQKNRRIILVFINFSQTTGLITPLQRTINPAFHSIDIGTFTILKKDININQPKCYEPKKPKQISKKVFCVRF